MLRGRRYGAAWKFIGLGVIAAAAVALCATALKASGEPEGPASAWESGALTLGIVGDSLTVGYMSDTEASTYRRQIESATYPGVLSLERVATSGASSGVMLSQSAGVIEESDVVLIATGTNDTAAHPDLSVLEAEYPALLAAVPDDKTLFCLGPWIRDTASNRAMQTMCETAGGTFISVADLHLLRGPEGEIAYPQPRDNFHPNQAGHDAIADRVIRALRAL